MRAFHGCSRLPRRQNRSTASGTQLHISSPLRSCQGAWSALPLDLRLKIMERLPTVDRVRFRSVCTSWNSTLPSLVPPHDIPWLLLPPPADSWEEDKYDEQEICFRQQHLRFYSMSEARTYKMNVDHLAAVAAYCQVIVSYSPDGWLMYMDKMFELRCVHLPTGEHIDPPSLATLPKGRYVQTDRRSDYTHCRVPRDYYEKMESSMGCYTQGIILFQSSIPGSLLNAPTAQNVWQNIPSTGRFYVIVVCNKDGFPAFARKGDASWTPVDISIHVFDRIQSIVLPIHIFDRIQSIVLHKDSLYLCGQSGKITYRIGVTPDLSLCAAEALPLVANVPSPDLVHVTTYLVEVDGRLCLIGRIADIFPVPPPNSSDPDPPWVFYKKTIDFSVFEMNEIQSTWVEVNTIGNYAIFLGNNYPFALSTLEFTHLAKNSIYFTDEDYRTYDLQHEWDLGIFSLEDRTLTSYCQGLNCVALPQPIWVMPFLFI